MVAIVFDYNISHLLKIHTALCSKDEVALVVLVSISNPGTSVDMLAEFFSLSKTWLLSNTAFLSKSIHLIYKTKYL